MPQPLKNHIHRAELLAPFCERLQKKEHALLLVLGDSNACNTTFTRGGKQWPELLHSELRDHFGTQAITMVNSAVSGDCCQRVLARFEPTALRFKPDLTIVALGANDTRLSEDDFRKGMTEIITRLQSGGSIVMLRTPAPIVELKPPPKHFWKGDDTLRARCDIVRQLAETHRLAFIDTYKQFWELEESGAVSTASLYSDEVHTSALGHQMVCRGMLSAFGAPLDFAWER